MDAGRVLLTHVSVVFIVTLVILLEMTSQVRNSIGRPRIIVPHPELAASIIIHH